MRVTSGEMVMFVRGRLGETQADFAARFGLSQASLSKMETGGLKVRQDVIDWCVAGRTGLVAPYVMTELERALSLVEGPGWLIDARGGERARILRRRRGLLMRTVPGKSRYQVRKEERMP